MIEKKFEASVKVLPQVISFVEEQLDTINCPIEISNQIQLAVEEIFVNIASYAYKGGTGSAQVSLDIKDKTIIISFKDCGIKFNPLEQNTPDVTLDASSRSIGGLGIFMVKKTMDKVEYKYESNQNVFTITKKY